MAFLNNSTPEMPLLSEDVQKGNDPQKQDDNCEAQDLHARTGIPFTCSVIIVAILTYVNLVTFIATYIFAGAMPYLQVAFKIEDSKIGWINIVFIIIYVLSGQVYGFLGDRCNRKCIVCAGIAFSSAAALATSFIPNEYFTVLLLINGLVAAGESGFSTIAPSIIADLFVGDQRSRALYIFNFGAPCGCGLGYIIGSKVTGAIGDWHWTFRIPPALGIIGVLLMAVFIKEPSRGAAEGKNTKPASSKRWISDAKQLLRNPSFMLCTFGTTTVKFTAGVIGFWTPIFLTHTRIIIQDNVLCQTEVCNYNDSMIFGVLLVVGGILGVVTGVEIAKRYQKYNACADPIVCGVGLLISAIFLFLAIFCANISLVATFIFIFIGQVFLTMNWSISTDIRLYVVSPASRSTAEAMSNMMTHLLGDAGSPFLIGLISDGIKRYSPHSDLGSFHSLQYALMVCPFVVVFGGIFFLASTHFIEKDRKEAETESEDVVLEEVIVTSP